MCQLPYDYGKEVLGKSKAGAHLAYVFAWHNKVLNRSHKCVLYCRPSNKAVDVALSEYMNINHDMFVVLRKLDSMQIHNYVYA